jgi:hypothetical protein
MNTKDNTRITTSDMHDTTRYNKIHSNVDWAESGEEIVSFCPWEASCHSGSGSFRLSWQRVNFSENPIFFREISYKSNSTGRWDIAKLTACIVYG